MRKQIIYLLSVLIIVSISTSLFAQEEDVFIQEQEEPQKRKNNRLMIETFYTPIYGGMMGIISLQYMADFGLGLRIGGGTAPTPNYENAEFYNSEFALIYRPFWSIISPFISVGFFYDINYQIDDDETHFLGFGIDLFPNFNVSLTFGGYYMPGHRFFFPSAGMSINW